MKTKKVMKYLKSFETFSITNTDNDDLLNAGKALSYLNLDKLKEYIKYNNFDDFKKRVDFIFNDPYIFNGLKIDDENYIEPSKIGLSELMVKFLSWSIEFSVEEIIEYLLKLYSYTKEEIEESIINSINEINLAYPLSIVKKEIKKSIDFIVKNNSITKNFKFDNIFDVLDICEKYEIKNFNINKDLTIDVHGSVNLSRKDLNKLPLGFRNVTGSFSCTDNQLVDLEGAPQSVGGYFHCTRNKLTSLEGAPRSVGGNFYCYSNKLTSLEGAPETVGGDFLCKDNPVFAVWDLFKDYSKIEMLNKYDSLKEVNGKPTVILDRLNQFLNKIGLERVESVDGWINA